MTKHLTGSLSACRGPFISMSRNALIMTYFGSTGLCRPEGRGGGPLLAGGSSTYRGRSGSGRSECLGNGGLPRSGGGLPRAGSGASGGLPRGGSGLSRSGGWRKWWSAITTRSPAVATLKLVTVVFWGRIVVSMLDDTGCMMRFQMVFHQVG